MNTLSGPVAALRVHLIRWTPITAAVAGIALFTWLGFWQLDRAAQKETMAAAQATRATDVPIYLNNRAKDLRDGGFKKDWWRFRPVEVAGTLLTGRQFLLDNRTRKGVAGYHVYTPLRLKRSRAVVLVNRGWIALGSSRDSAPDISLDESDVALRGVVDFPRLTMLLGADGFGTGEWPRVVQRMDLTKVANDLKSPVLPIVILLDPDEPNGFRREWSAFLGIGPDRHRAYAFQWFTLALAVLVITVVVRRRARRNGS